MKAARRGIGYAIVAAYACSLVILPFYIYFFFLALLGSGSNYGDSWAERWWETGPTRRGDDVVTVAAAAVVVGVAGNGPLSYAGF